MPDEPFAAVELRKGRRLTVSGGLVDRERPATVERILTMAERHDVFIRLTDGTTLILMIRKDEPT